MPDEQGPGSARLRRLAAVVVAGAVLAGAPGGAARADDLKALLQVQYQRQEANGLARDLWVETYQVDDAQRVASQLDLIGQFQFVRSTTAGTGEQIVTPRGLFRVSHPEFGLLISDRPLSQTDALGHRNDQQEQQLSAFVARLGLPRLDFNWTRRHQNDAVGYPAGTNINRALRATQDFGGLNLHGGWGYQTQQLAGGGAAETYLKNYDAGARFAGTLFRKVGMQAQYDFTDNQNGSTGGSTLKTLGHSATLTAGMRMSAKSDWNLSYNFRRTESSGTQSSTLNYHDGALTFGYYPTRASRLMLAGGVRTDQNAAETQLIGYLMLSASADGYVRPGWKGSASASRALNRTPDGLRFWVDSYRLASRWELAKGLSVLADAQASSNGDTGSVDSRDVVQYSAGLSATPLPALTTDLSYRVYDVGPNLTDVSSRSRASVWSIRWMPSSLINLFWSHNVTGALPTAQPMLASNQLNVDFRPWDELQLTVNRSTSDQSRSAGVTTTLSGTEVDGVRVLAALSSSFRASLGYNVANPGKANRSSAWDVSLTKNFGR